MQVPFSFCAYDSVCRQVRSLRIAPSSANERGREADQGRDKVGEAQGARPAREGAFLQDAKLSAFRKILIDSPRRPWLNRLRCFDVRRYLSWIEGLTTNQYVGGSNPSRRTTSASLIRNDWQQHVRFFVV